MLIRGDQFRLGNVTAPDDVFVESEPVRGFARFGIPGVVASDNAQSRGQALLAHRVERLDQHRQIFVRVAASNKEKFHVVARGPRRRGINRANAFMNDPDASGGCVTAEQVRFDVAARVIADRNNDIRLARDGVHQPTVHGKQAVLFRSWSMVAKQ